MSNPLADDIQHVIGNSVFAIETNIETLERRINRTMPAGGDQTECNQILAEMVASIEKIKAFIARN